MRVVIAVDLHHQPEHIVDLGSAWAVRLGATADLLYAGSQGLGSWAYNAATEPPHPNEDANVTLGRLLGRVPEAYRGSAEVVAGRAIDVIPRRGAEYDLVIVGTHGREGFHHLIAGSVAERVVRTTAKPVLVVRGAPPDGRFPVLCAVDVQDPKAATIVAEMMLPWIERLGTADLAYVTPVGATEASVSEAADKLGHLEEAIPAGLRGQGWLETGDPAETLVSGSISHALTMLVTHGRTGLDRWWLGSVAEQFVRVAPRSVLVLHRPA